MGNQQEIKQQNINCKYNKIFMPIVIALSIFCCKDSKTFQGNNIGSISLTYWCAPNQQEIDLAQELVEKWNSSNDSFKVLLQPIPASQSSEEVLLAAIAGGTTPDICSNMWPGAMDDFVKAGGLIRLDEFPDFDDYVLDRVPEDLLESFKASDGHLYQIPWKSNPIMVIYNVKMFREAGVSTIPRTYSEFLDAAGLITKDINGDGSFDQWMGYRDVKPIWWQRLFDYYTFYIVASGGKTLFEGSEIIFNNQASVRVFKFFQDLYANGYFPVAALQGDNFIAGRVATQFTGPWSISYLQKFKPPEFEYDIFPIPIPDGYSGSVYTYGDYKNISIFSTTKYPKGAWEFVKFLISQESDLRLLELCSQIPVRKDIIADSMFIGFFQSNPKLKKFAEQASFTRGVDGVSDLKEIFDCISQEYEACAIYQAKSPEEAVKDAANRAKVVMKWNRSK